MKKEEAELKLKRYHAKLFSKHADKNPKPSIANEFDVFEIIGYYQKAMFFKRCKPYNVL